MKRYLSVILTSYMTFASDQAFAEVKNTVLGIGEAWATHYLCDEGCTTQAKERANANAKQLCGSDTTQVSEWKIIGLFDGQFGQSGAQASAEFLCK